MTCVLTIERSANTDVEAVRTSTCVQYNPQRGPTNVFTVLLTTPLILKTTDENFRTA